MSLFFFTYTITILFICVIAATFCLAALVVTHRKRYIPQAAFFVAYFIELSSIFGSEWLEQNTSTIDASNYYDLTNPLFRILIGVIILASLWYVILDVIDVRLALEDKSNREIASELVLAEGTIKTHLHNIMKKCGVANREELKQDFWAS